MVEENDLEINPSLYELSVRIISAVRQRLGINIKLHGHDADLKDGQIFLFNHFARFETFIPQYLIYKRTGAFSRSIATPEIFDGSETFGNYLRGVGAVPNTLDGILPFLAAEILRGRKVIIFPEGGMVKDRRVIDKDGHYKIYSRSAHERRKHHTGAAVLALTLDAFKAAILALHAEGEDAHIQRWADILKLESSDALLTAARQPTLIIPSNITFFPIRVKDNILRQGADLLGQGMSKRFNEELLIEGNLLLKRTDMDLRLGTPIKTKKTWHWYERWLLMRVIKKADSMAELFSLNETAIRWEERMTAKGISQRSLRIRDHYMKEMYEAVTINISHLASRIFIELMDQGRNKIEKSDLHKILYLAIHKLRQDPAVFLHRSLRNPEAYMDLLDGHCSGLDQLLRSAERADLIRCDTQCYFFQPKLLEEHGFDEIRLENPVLVYANEAAPIEEVLKAVCQAISEVEDMTHQDWSRLMFEDETVLHSLMRNKFTKPKYADIHDQETATESGQPFLKIPSENNLLGVVLTHGFLASPAEMEEFGMELAAHGHPVIGPRLAGHGTSPWDLKDRTWENWLGSVKRAYQILSPFCERIVLVGFSTGGALSLMLASEKPDKLAGVAAIAAPIKFKNRNMMFVPLVHGANKFLEWAPGIDAVMPFRQNNAEHPNINYHHMPISGLYELKQMADTLEGHLKNVSCPTLVMQATDDHVVDPDSGDIIFEGLGTEQRTLHRVPTDRHGILYEDVGGTRETIAAFIKGLL